MKIILHKNKAFTLIETTIAVALFGICLLVGLLLMTFAVKSTRANRQNAYANRVLETTLENIRNLSWTELTAQPTTQSFDVSKPLIPLFGKAINTAISTGSEYEELLQDATGTIVIDAVAGRSNLRRVTVNVNRSSVFTKKTIRSSLSTYVSENGIDRR